MKIVGLALLFGAVWAAPTPLDDDELLSVIVVFRHGDRTPVATYPADPYNNMEVWEEDWGQLTNQGKNRHFQLGQWFRQRYTNFLSPYYNHSEIWACSTDVERTLMSAESNLAGLYPPKDTQIWNQALPWQPIPVHTCPIAIMNTQTECTKFQALQAQLLLTEKYRTIDKTNEQLYEYLQTNSGASIGTIMDVWMLRDTLFVESHNNLELPEWTLEVYPEQLDPIAGEAFATYSATTAIQRLNAGPFLQNTIEHFEQVLNGTNKKPKFLMYSAHDSSVASVLGALGAFKPHCPYFASTVILELRKKSSGAGVINVFYKSQEDIAAVRVKGCTTTCKLEDFKGNLTGVAITDTQWVRECYLPNVGVSRKRVDVVEIPELDPLRYIT